MKSKLHIASKMFLQNPYVVRVRHPECPNELNIRLGEFRKMLKTAKTQIADTWGYSNLTFEVIKSDSVRAVAFNGQAMNFFIPSSECHSYWVFTNELDALQFRLSIGENALQMHMWPTNIKFTITEYYDDENTG